MLFGSPFSPKSNYQDLMILVLKCLYWTELCPPLPAPQSYVEALTPNVFGDRASEEVIMHK